MIVLQKELEEEVEINKQREERKTPFEIEIEKGADLAKLCCLDYQEKFFSKRLSNTGSSSSPTSSISNGRPRERESSK